MPVSRIHRVPPDNRIIHENSSSVSVQPKTVSERLDKHGYGERGRAAHEMCKDDLIRLPYPDFRPKGPCPKCPPLNFAGITKDNAYKCFIGKSPCGERSCPACYPVRIQENLVPVHFAVQKMLDDYGSGQSGFETKLPSNEDWSKYYEEIRKAVKSKSDWYASYRVDGEKTVWSNMPLPNSVEMTLEGVYENAVNLMGSTTPESKEPYFSPMRGENAKQWRPTKDYLKKEKEWTLLGPVACHEAEAFLRVLKDANGLHPEWVGNVPDAWRWKVRYSLRDLTPKQICKALHNIGLRPRKGETMNELVERLWALWALCSPEKRAA